MRIFITGGTGFIGRYIVHTLKEKYRLILPVRDKKRAYALFGKTENITLLDFSENLEQLVVSQKPDLIINLLGILTESKGNSFEKVHVEYTKQLVNGALETGFVKFIQMSALGADVNSKSRYAKTKAQAELYVKNSGLEYVIFRPSIIIGREQRLFKDLKRFSKIAPFFLAPKGKVQPVHIYDVVDCFIKVVEENIKNETFELCGSMVVSYKKLFEFALSFTGVKKPVIEMPVGFFFLLLPFFSVLPEPPFTKDQLYMLQKDNVCTGKFKGTQHLLGFVRNPFDI